MHIKERTSNVKYKHKFITIPQEIFKLLDWETDDEVQIETDKKKDTLTIRRIKQ